MWRLDRSLHRGHHIYLDLNTDRCVRRLCRTVYVKLSIEVIVVGANRETNRLYGRIPYRKPMRDRS
jgi:hypothetical protein